MLFVHGDNPLFRERHTTCEIANRAKNGKSDFQLQKTQHRPTSNSFQGVSMSSDRLFPASHDWRHHRITNFERTSQMFPGNYHSGKTDGRWPKGETLTNTPILALPRTTGHYALDSDACSTQVRCLKLQQKADLIRQTNWYLL